MGSIKHRWPAMIWFSSPQPTTASNDFPAGTAFNSLDIASGDFTLAGNGLQLGNSFTVGQNAAGVCALPIAVSGQITVEVDSSTPLVISGVVSGQGSLVKTGSGSLTLSGPNVYGGPTTITTGTLQVGAATTNGPVAGDIVGSAAVAIGNASDQTNGGGRFANDRTMTTLTPQERFQLRRFHDQHGFQVSSSFTVLRIRYCHRVYVRRLVLPRRRANQRWVDDWVGTFRLTPWPLGPAGQSIFYFRGDERLRLRH